MFNFAGNSRPLNATNRFSLHHSNPGLGATPAANTELTDAPYERKSCTFPEPVAAGTAAVSALQTTVQFPLDMEIDQAVGFVGLWENDTYLGYLPRAQVAVYDGSLITNRRLDVLAETTVLVRDNPAQAQP